MTILADPPRANPVTPVLLQLVGCVCNELTLVQSLCWCGLWPGLEVSWDYCGECGNENCGMGWVRLAAVFPYDDFPNPAIDVRCVKPLTAQIEVGALRCVPIPNEGTVNDPLVMTEVAVHQAEDTLALYRAIQCCGVELAVGAYTPAGPQGGCVGGFWTAFLPID